MTLENAPATHRRLLADVLDLGHDHGLALGGGYAVLAHGLVALPQALGCARARGRDLDFVTERPVSAAEIVGHLTAGLRARGWLVGETDVSPLMARMTVADPDTEEMCEVVVAKEVLWRPPVVLEGVGPVLAVEDLAGTKVRALVDRGLPRDMVDVYAAGGRFSTAELEHLGARHDEDFDLRELRDRLEGLEWVSDGEFQAYGLAGDQVRDLRGWAGAWAQDIAERLAEPYEEPDEEPDEDAYEEPGAQPGGDG
ncbi:nucleotidyl transferase AbiEii/AbiGii toxin family protein [Streptomyces sannanensis]|uniref:nucleotidyl transferase AbiEii/AbiGii toxin family protein n=1 Tax=Streptomyces sannanensis TaxID=285536 RepID=UPI0031EF9A73